jgi:hypothetical protein
MALCFMLMCNTVMWLVHGLEDRGLIYDRGKKNFISWLLRPDRLWGPRSCLSEGSGACFPGPKV